MPTIDLKSPLLDLKEALVDPPKYTDEEETYLKGLRTRLEKARLMRDQTHDEFDGMDYVTHYDVNQKLANTFIGPKRNKEDTNFQSGTIRQKKYALLSAVVNLDLHGDISAFDDQGLEVQSLGDAVEDVMLKTDDLDNDDEKKFLRHDELLTQGHVFVEEIWDERSKKDKKLKGKFTGQVKGVEWSTKIKKAFARPSRNIIPGLNVYLGDITKYDISEQPFVYTVDRKPYEEAKMIFGEWERWENVPKCEYLKIVRYQDKWNNEFALLIGRDQFWEGWMVNKAKPNEDGNLNDAVLMTPVGLPLPWGYEEYNIAQQNLEPIHSKFAYGKSLVSRLRNKTLLLDEMIRLAVLKTQKSFMPPRYNVSGRVVSSRVLMPGKFVYGLAPNSLPPIEGENLGVTQSEMAMIKQIQESIDQETTSPTFSGQQSDGNPTATEIIELQRQAKMVLGLTVFSMSMLEWKLEWLRLQNILKNWFNEEDKAVDQARGILKSKFRTVSVERPIEGEGMGRRITIPTKEIPSPQAIKTAEDALAEEQGSPVRLIFLNPEEVTSSKLIWQIVIRPKERKTSETEKLMFRAFMQDIAAFGPTVNTGFLQEEFASVWSKDPKKLFLPQEMVPQPSADGASLGASSVSPRVNLPSAESANSRQMKTAMGMTA